MSLFEALRTDRLIVRRLREEDAEGVAAYRSRSEVARFQTPYSLAKAEALVQEMSKSDPSERENGFNLPSSTSPKAD